MAQDNSVIEVWVVRAKEGVLTILTGTDAIGILSAASIKDAQDREGVSIPITTIAFAEMIVNVGKYEQNSDMIIICS